MCSSAGASDAHVGLRCRIHVGDTANIHARISDLAESQRAALEYAHAAATAATAHHLTANELLRCEILKRQSLERHEHRTHLRLQRAVELLIAGGQAQRNRRRKIEWAAYWNH